MSRAKMRKNTGRVGGLAMPRKTDESVPESADNRAYIASLIGRTPTLIVEVGAGACACQTLVLARLGFRVLAIDRDIRAVRGARKIIARARLSGRVDVVRADAAQLPLRARSAHVVVAYSALHHVNDLGAVVRGIAAALRPNGRLIVGDLDEEKNGFLGRLSRALQAAFGTVIIIPRERECLYVCEQPWVKGSRGAVIACRDGNPIGRQRRDKNSIRSAKASRRAALLHGKGRAEPDGWSAFGYSGQERMETRRR
jgi:SAM-dependent methyltransferase